MTAPFTHAKRTDNAVAPDKLVTDLAEHIGGPLPHASDNLKMALARVTTDQAYRDRYHPDSGSEWLTREPEQSASMRKLAETLERLSDPELVAHSKDQRQFNRLNRRAGGSR